MHHTPDTAYDPYGDLDPAMEPLWLLDPAIDALVLDTVDPKAPPTLQGLRRAAARITDLAASLTPHSRARTHQELWDDALGLAEAAYAQVREERTGADLADLRDRVLVHLARTDTDQHERDVRDLLGFIRDHEEELRPFARASCVRLLAGVAVWLPLIGHTLDALHAEGPTLRALLQDHLDDLGVTGATAGTIDGCGPEGLEIAAPAGRILLSTSTEHLSLPLGASAGLLTAYHPADADQDPEPLHTTEERPVTRADLQSAAHTIATALDALKDGTPPTLADTEPTILDVLTACLRRAGFDPTVYAFDGFQALQAHRRNDSAAVIYNATEPTLDLPLAQYQGLQAIRFESGADPTTDEGCLGWGNYSLWDEPLPARDALGDITAVVAAITADATTALG